MSAEQPTESPAETVAWAGPEKGPDAVPAEDANEAAEAFDLDSPEWYLNREQTWLEFNRRVLHEAEDERTPLLERIKFVAIVANNLDEFFMKRIGGLKQQVGAGVHELSVDGRTPQQQIDECTALVRDILQHKVPLLPVLFGLLADEGIRVRRYEQLDDEQRDAVREEYLRNIYPLVTPMVIDPAHPFPFVSNLSLNLLVTVRGSGQSSSRLVRIKVPISSGSPRFLRVGDADVFVPLEDVIAHNLDLVLPGAEIERWDLFRVTRNAITERSEEQANDLLELIEAEVRDRKFAPIVRLEVSAGMSEAIRGMLAAELGLDEESDVFDAEGLLQLRDLSQLMSVDRPELKDPPHHAVEEARLAGTHNVFHLIRREGPILLQHPYESFTTSVERFVQEASRDPKVLAIKMTLYRTAERSRIIEYLIDAAQNGKQVAVAVELKARFDETANIRWANYLEEAGIHVSYGVVGLKTHSKVIFVLRRDYDGLRRYAHIGTGNYHAVTARLYSDLGMLTCDPAIGEDLTEFFNFLTTGFAPKRAYQKLLPSPKHLKPALLSKIEREIEHEKAGRGGLIQFKMNALEDKDVTRALYEASQAGVRVDLLVRDTCRLRPGIPGLSESARVISTVGRFLEHTRIFYFRNDGEEEYFIGSADAMRRNLRRRVELVAPVEHPALREELRQMIDVQLGDRRSAWDMQPDGRYVQRKPGPDDDPRTAQEVLIELTQKRQKKLLKAATIKLPKKGKKSRKGKARR